MQYTEPSVHVYFFFAELSACPFISVLKDENGKCYLVYDGRAFPLPPRQSHSEVGPMGENESQIMRSVEDEASGIIHFLKIARYLL